MTEPLLRIEGLTVSFTTSLGAVQALRSVNLTVPRGRIVGIVGESGSGKSTLALAILRLLPANTEIASGRVLLDGEDLMSLTPESLRRVRGHRISMIFQDPMTSLNPVYTVETHLVDAQRAGDPSLSGAEMRARAAAMLARVGIPDVETRLAAYPHQLSGGMRQRVMIAMALLTEPEILIADEATTALDVTIEAQIVELIRRLKADYEGSILFVSHSLGLVSELCEEVVVMYAGTVVETASSADLFADPKHPYTQALLRCELTLDSGGDERLLSIAGDLPSLIDLPRGCIFAARCPHRMARCLEAVPPLLDIGGGRQAACWLL
jgi:peptide/nickel transport system ATP-binding protein